MRILLIIIFSVLAVKGNLPSIPDEQNELYLQAMKKSKDGDVQGAIRLLEKSILKYRDAPSCFELGKIYMDFHSLQGNEKSRDLLRQALWKEPDNLDYRLKYTELLKRMNINTRGHFEKILQIDSTNALAWLELGKIHESEFYEYQNSSKDAGEILLSYDEFTEQDFKSAEHALKKAIQFYPELFEANFHLCRLYQEAGYPDKAIILAEKLILSHPDSINVILTSGVLYYETLDFKKVSDAFEKAIRMMDDEQKMVYETSTVVPLFDMKFRNLFDQDTALSKEAYIQRFWAERDPLLLTEYNERLLEHYVRVTYANYKFSIPGKVDGWKTDRGESVIRYGRPEQWLRLRPQLTLQTDGLSLEAKTDVWQYSDMTLAFTEEFASGNFRFSEPSLPGNNVRSQYLLDTELFVRGLKNSTPEKYNPKFKSAQISVPFEVLQFKTGDSTGKTDLIVNYELDPSMLSDRGMGALPKHEYGLFFLRDGYKKTVDHRAGISEREHLVEINRAKKIINSAKVSLVPDSGLLVFEVMRQNAQGFSANRLPLVVEKFDTPALGMSDIILAAELEFQPSGKYFLRRHNIYILPNPSHNFAAGKSLNVYYEIYNLSLDINKMTNFEQRIIVESFDGSNKRNIFSGIFDIIKRGLGFQGYLQKVELQTPYQTKDKDSQIYYELDMDNYIPGLYKLSIEITDNLSGQMTRKEQIFYFE